MIEICVSSDIYDQYVLVDIDDLDLIGEFQQIKKELLELYEIEPSYEWLKDCGKHIESKIAELLQQKATFKRDIFNTIVSISYNGRMIELNYRDKTHLLIGLLISIYKLFKKAIEENGHVYIYNRTLLNQYPLNTILISCLKNYKKLNINELRKNCISRWEPVSNLSFNDEMVRSIELLITLRLIQFDNEDNYMITAKGLALIL